MKELNFPPVIKGAIDWFTDWAPLEYFSWKKYRPLI